jgi:hypothetical protein
MSQISFKWLDVNAIATLSDFFISRLVSSTTCIMIISSSSFIRVYKYINSFLYTSLMSSPFAPELN